MSKTPQKNPRTEAAKIIQSVIYQGESLTAALSNNDSPMVSDLCYGSLRWHEPISFILNELMSKKLKNKDKDIECLIRIGLYQIIYQNTPDHAAVAETVNALKGLKKPWAKNLVNAVLRNFIRGQEKLLKQKEEYWPAKFAFPQWLLDRIKNAYPKNWEDIFAQSNQRAPMTLRVNLNHQSRDVYLEKLKSMQIEAQKVDEIETAIMLEKPQDVYGLPGFEKGEVSVQDAAAQNATILLDCQDGMTVLDACAAPGGKTGHILESAKHLNVIAIDSSETRLKRVTENLERLNLKAKVIASNALDTENYAKDTLFDRILLDAPCSATGVIRRHPDIKVLRRDSDIKQLQQLQSDILDALWSKLKSQGIMVYATCSILPDENETQIQAFAKRHHDVEVLPIAKAQGLGRQVFPGEDGMDGFYYAKLLKT